MSGEGGVSCPIIITPQSDTAHVANIGGLICSDAMVEVTYIKQYISESFMSMRAPQMWALA